MRLFRISGFSASVATYGLSILILFGGFLFVPQYLQLVIGLSPFESGLWMLPGAVSFIVGSTITPPIARRVQPALVMAGGLAFAAIGFALFTRAGSSIGFAVFATGSSIF